MGNQTPGKVSVENTSFRKESLVAPLALPVVIKARVVSNLSGWQNAYSI